MTTWIATLLVHLLIARVNAQYCAPGQSDPLPSTKFRIAIDAVDGSFYGKLLSFDIRLNNGTAAHPGSYMISTTGRNSAPPGIFYFINDGWLTTYGPTMDDKYNGELTGSQQNSYDGDGICFFGKFQFETDPNGPAKPVKCKYCALTSALDCSLSAPGYPVRTLWQSYGNNDGAKITLSSYLYAGPPQVRLRLVPIMSV